MAQKAGRIPTFLERAEPYLQRKEALKTTESVRIVKAIRRKRIIPEPPQKKK